MPLDDIGARALAETRAWVDHAVIGLNLCPFAKAVQVKGLVRYELSQAQDVTVLRDDLAAALRALADGPADEVETTVLVHPWVLQDFHDYNAFLAVADATVRRLRLRGVIQVASFHPQYQFADTAVDDISNATNRSPWPCLHLIRESSIDRAVEAFPEAEAIYETNMATLASLGPEGWARLQARWQLAPADAQDSKGAIGGAQLGQADGDPRQP